MMTNVPPSIANYRQRVGRAGRRGQAVALAFTFCKDRPLDSEAFRDPRAYLQRTLAAPKVTLSSRPIVQRHVNAFLLGSFMRERAGDALKMQIGAFLGCPADPKEARPPKAERPVEGFIEWLERPATARAYTDGLATLTRRSILEGDQRPGRGCKGMRSAELANGFVAEWEGLVALAKDEGLQDAGKSRMAVELRRMCGEFLLGSLADRGFLPGHGFPTDVVSFMPGKEFKSPQEARLEGARQFRTVGPQRSLDLAIRDYAPGSEVVLDGLVYKSAGVTLNWKRPANEENVAEIQSLRYLWHCAECGASDIKRGGASRLLPGLRRRAARQRASSSAPPASPLIRGSARMPTRTRSPMFRRKIRSCPRVMRRGRACRFPHWGVTGAAGKALSTIPIAAGRGGFGYAICLQCGRAETDSDNRGPARPRRRSSTTSRCVTGKARTCVRATTNLSASSATSRSAWKSLPTSSSFSHNTRCAGLGANALAIALREALAQELGVEADEMGFAVGQSQNALGAPAVSLFLFDRAAGGAGFAVSLEHLMRPVIRRAEQILDCKTPGCEKACAACVLTSDAPGGKDELDRTAALAFLRAHLIFPEELGPDDRFIDGCGPVARAA